MVIETVITYMIYLSFAIHFNNISFLLLTIIDIDILTLLILNMIKKVKLKQEGK